MLFQRAIIVTIDADNAECGSGGGSDANFFNRYGVPNAVLGTGMSKVHTKEEFIREEHLFQTTEWVLQLIKQTAHLKTT